MPFIRLVTLDSSCGSHVTNHSLEELRRIVNQESSCKTRVSVIEPGVILLESQDGMDEELNRILQLIQIFTTRFISCAFFLSEKEANEVKSMLLPEAGCTELSFRTLDGNASGELIRITGKRDSVDAFLSTHAAYRKVEEVSIIRSFINENTNTSMSCTSTAVTIVHEISEEQWEFLKLLHFHERPFLTRLEVRILFDKPGSIHFSGDGSEVQKAIEEVYRCLDSRQVKTYCKSKAVVECLKLSWCKNLLQRKWKLAKITAVVSVTKHSTALITCVGDLAMAMHILESTIMEARPIALPEDFFLSVAAPIWEAIESAALGKAAIVLDHTVRQIVVAGNVEQLSDVVEQILKIINSGRPHDVYSRTLTGSSSNIEVANRHYATEGSGAIRTEICHGSMPSNENKLVGATAVDMAVMADVSTKSANKSEHPSRVKHSDHHVAEIEQETSERRQRRNNETRPETTSVGYGSTAEMNRDVGNGRQAVREEQCLQVSQVMPFSEGLQNYTMEGYMHRNLHVQVINGSVCLQTADVLVNSVTATLDLSKGVVSQAFLKKAGAALQDELNKKRPATKNSLLITENHGLDCYKLFHVVCDHYSGQKSVLELSKVVCKCLSTAENMAMTSIVFPPIGSGGLGYPIESVAEAFQDAMEDFNRQRPLHLKLVICAIFDEDNYKKFERELQALEQQRRSERGPSLLYNDPEPQRRRENSLNSHNSAVLASKSAVMSDADLPKLIALHSGQNPVLSSKSAVISDADLRKRIALHSVHWQSTYRHSWEAMGEETVKLFGILKHSQEYKEVDMLFSDCRRKMHVETVEIFRIQDKIQWIMYCEQREKMKRSNGTAKELETMLWFSSPQEDIRGLLQSGHLLSRSNAVRQDYGKGAYFYREAITAISDQIPRTSVRSPKCIILATVLTGQYVLGSPSMVTLPQIPGSGRKYDSSVDKVNNPTIFVVYHDAQACPLYAIKIK